MTTGKKNRAKMPPVSAPTTPQSLAAMRLRLLIQQLEQEYGGTRGVRARIARETGVHQSTISNFQNERRKNVKGEIIDRVLQKFRSADGRVLHRDFFYKKLPHDPDYQDYLVTPGSPLPSTPPPMPDTGASTSIDDDEYTEAELIAELQPHERELKTWRKHIKRFNYPSTAPWVQRAFIQGMREERTQLAMDEARDKMGDALVRKDEPKKR